MRLSFGYCMPLTLLVCCITACENGTPVRSPGSDDVQGTWRITEIEEDSAISESGSRLVGLMGLLGPSNNERNHVFTGTEYMVTDNSGNELARWPYEVRNTVLVISGDTCTLRWINGNSFALVTDNVKVRYERLQKGRE